VECTIKFFILTNFSNDKGSSGFMTTITAVTRYTQRIIFRRPDVLADLNIVNQIHSFIFSTGPKQYSLHARRQFSVVLQTTCSNFPFRGIYYTAVRPQRLYSACVSLEPPSVDGKSNAIFSLNVVSGWWD